jgi:thiol:disulfide interchange protein DsbD
MTPLSIAGLITILLVGAPGAMAADEAPPPSRRSAEAGAAQRPAPADDSEGFAAPEEQPVTAELITEHASVKPAGGTRVGVRFDVAEGWHIYGQEPGDAGMPTTVSWEGPAGVLFGPIAWPEPEQFRDPGDIVTYGYSGAVVLASQLSVGRSIIAGSSLPLRASVKWVACRQICIPGSATLELILPVSGAPPAASTHAELFEHVP